MQSLHHLEIVSGEIRRVHRFFWRFLSKTTSCYKQETSSRHWIPGQYGRPPHQPQLNSTVSHLCSLRTRGAPSVAGVKSLCIIGRASSSQEGCSAVLESSKESLFPRFWSQKTATNKRTIAPRTNYFAFFGACSKKDRRVQLKLSIWIWLFKPLVMTSTFFARFQYAVQWTLHCSHGVQ